MRPLSRTGRPGLTGGAAAAMTLGGLAVLVTACGTASPSAGSGTTAGHVSSTHAARHDHHAAQSRSATSGPPAKRHHHAGGGSATSGSGGSGAGGSGSGGSGSGGSGTAAAPGCQSANLGVTAASSQGTAGSVYATVTFTNRGAQTCTLYGYPGVSAGTGSPYHQVGFAAQENPSPPRELVTLPPGGVASAVLQVAEAGNYSAGQCRPRPTSELQVYPPNQTQALYTSYSATGCAGSVRLLTVSVVQPGHTPQA